MSKRKSLSARKQQKRLSRSFSMFVSAITASTRKHFPVTVVVRDQNSYTDRRRRNRRSKRRATKLS